MVTQDDIMDVLKQCYDPELSINIVDLGLIYNVSIEDKTVSVDMTLTTRGCPMHSFIAHDVKQKLETIPDVKEVNVKVVWDPPWTPDRLSEEAKKMLGFT